MRLTEILRRYFVLFTFLLFTASVQSQNSLNLLTQTYSSNKTLAKENDQELNPDMLPSNEMIMFRGNDSAADPIVDVGEPFKATHIDFLHTCDPGESIEEWRIKSGVAHRKIQLPPEKPVMFYYEVEYIDNSTIKIPVKYGESINQWYRLHEVSPMLWAQPSWIKKINEKTGEKVAAYKMRWPNPKPETPIQDIRVIKNEKKPYSHYGNIMLFEINPRVISSSGSNYYVDSKPKGSDRNEGSFEKPFGTIQHALDVAEPGDHVYLRGGLYSLDDRVVLKHEGEESKWLTISSFFGEKPVLEGYGINWKCDDINWTENDSWKDIEELGRAQHDHGILTVIGDPSFVRIQGLQIQHSRFAGISIYGEVERGSGSSGSEYFGPTDKVDVRFNTVYKTYSMGIIIHWVNNVSVIGNTIVRPHSTQMGSNPYTGEPAAFQTAPQEGIDLSRNKGFEIAYNTVAGGGKEAIDCISIKEGEIHHNYLHSCLNGIYIDSWSVTIEGLNIHHNFIHNTFYGIPLSNEGGADLTDIKIHHNIVHNTKSGGISVSTYTDDPAKVQDIDIINNTVDRTAGQIINYGWDAAGIRVYGKPNNEKFRNINVINNIVTNSQSKTIFNSYYDKPDHNVDFTNNLVYPLEEQTPEWMSQESGSWSSEYNIEGKNTIAKAPLYIKTKRGNFNLENNSPAFDKGINGGDLGALTKEQKWIGGYDWTGKATAFYYGDYEWETVSIPGDKYTIHRNHLQRPSWFQFGRYGPDFQNLPSGHQALSGKMFFFPEEANHVTPTVMALKGLGSESKAAQIKDIPVNRKAEAMAFLHTFNPGKNDLEKGKMLFHYRINYADGSSENIPVRLEEEIDSWISTDGELKNLENAKLAWNNMAIEKRYDGKWQLRLYSMEWENPQPDKEISTIDIIKDSEFLDGAPAVFAISLGTEL